MRVTGLDHVVLVGPDAERLIAWYVDVLGLEPCAWSSGGRARCRSRRCVWTPPRSPTCSCPHLGACSASATPTATAWNCAPTPDQATPRSATCAWASRRARAAHRYLRASRGVRRVDRPVPGGVGGPVGRGTGPGPTGRLTTPTTALWPEHDPPFPRKWSDRVGEQPPRTPWRHLAHGRRCARSPAGVRGRWGPRRDDDRPVSAPVAAEACGSR